MRSETIALLRCPSGCNVALCLEEETGRRAEVTEGVLLCNECGERYPIENGIARMLPHWLAYEAADPEDEGHAREIARKRSEMAARDAQVEDYDKMKGLAWFSRVEIPATLRRLDLHAAATLLEVGCGTGRMTPIFAIKCHRIIAFDFSFESLSVCQRKLRAAGVTNVDLVQADACRLPIRSEIGDRVVSCQVLEHVPTVESRERMVGELGRAAKQDGVIVLSAYQHSWFTRLLGDKEGAHEGGIYFYRFHRAEFRDLLARHLRVESMTGALVYHFLARCRK